MLIGFEPHSGEIWSAAAMLPLFTTGQFESGSTAAALQMRLPQFKFTTVNGTVNS